MFITDRQSWEKASAAGSGGFTLIEMMTVVLLICILMAATGLSVRKAGTIAKNTRAEAECRELVNALLEYRSTYGEWPGGDDKAKGEVEATDTYLKPLTDASANAHGIVFLNLTLAGSKWNDPWGNAYRIFFPDGSQPVSRPSALETCVAFPFRRPVLQSQGQP